MDDYSFLFSLILMPAIVICVLAICFTIVCVVALRKEPAGVLEVARMLSQNGSLIQMAAVVLVVVAVFTLGMTERLNSGSVSSLLGAIAGYVLGQIKTGKKIPDEKAVKRVVEVKG